jgi:hypothetical protein
LQHSSLTRMESHQKNLFLQQSLWLARNFKT